MVFDGRIPGESTASSEIDATTHAAACDRGRLARRVLANHRLFLADEMSATPGWMSRAFLVLLVGVKHQTRMLTQRMKLDVGEVLQRDLDLGIVRGEECGRVYGVMRDAVGVGVQKAF